MTDWRLYFAILNVSLLPVSRAGAVEVRLSPSSLSWYFGFLETYVFPFILAASIALLIGYGLSRLFERSPKTFERLREADEADATPDWETPTLQMPDPSPMPAGTAPTDVGPGEPVVSRNPNAARPAGMSEIKVAPAGGDTSMRTSLSSSKLVKRIRARAAEQAAADGSAFDPQRLESALAPAVKTEVLLQRIAADATEQASNRQGRGREDDPAPADDGRTIAAHPDDRLPPDDIELARQATENTEIDDNQSPAQRLDALLARIGARPSDAAADQAKGGAADSNEALDADQSPAARLDTLIQRIGARASSQPVDDSSDDAAERQSTPNGDLSPAEKLDALIRGIGPAVPPDVTAADNEAAEDIEETGADETPGIDPDRSDRADFEATEKIIAGVDTTDSFETPDAPDRLPANAPEIDLPGIDAAGDGAMEESDTQRTEPTIGPSSGSSGGDQVGAETEPSFDAAMDVPIDVEPEQWFAAGEDAPIDVEPEFSDPPAMDAPNDIEPEFADAPFDVEPAIADVPVGPDDRESGMTVVRADMDAAGSIPDEASHTPAAGLEGPSVQVAAEDSGQFGADLYGDEEGARPPSEAVVEPISAIGISADPDAATRMAARIAGDFEDAVKILDRLRAIVDGYEAAREGLDLEAVNGMRVAGFDLPDGTESVLHRLGTEVPDSAVAGYGEIGRFNHVVDRLAEMARNDPLDEGWNELLQDRILEAVRALSEGGKRLRRAGSGDWPPEDTDGGAPSGDALRREAAEHPPGRSVGGE